jgi:hypothetical protein
MKAIMELETLFFNATKLKSIKSLEVYCPVEYNAVLLSGIWVAVKKV